MYGGGQRTALAVNPPFPVPWRQVFTTAANELPGTMLSVPTPTPHAPYEHWVTDACATSLVST